MKFTFLRRPLIPLSVIFVVAGVASCTDESSYMPRIAAMRDSIFSAYPANVASVTIKVEDKTNLKIVLGGGELYKFPADKRQFMANDLGLMAMRIFGKDSYLRAGKLIVTKDERNSSESPADGVVSEINIDSLKKISAK